MRGLRGGTTKSSAHSFKSTTRRSSIYSTRAHSMSSKRASPWTPNSSRVCELGGQRRINSLSKTSTSLSVNQQRKLLSSSNWVPRTAYSPRTTLTICRVAHTPYSASPSNRRTSLTMRWSQCLNCSSSIWLALRSKHSLEPLGSRLRKV
jgi:hypothetical protein